MRCSRILGGGSGGGGGFLGGGRGSSGGNNGSRDRDNNRTGGAKSCSCFTEGIGALSMLGQVHAGRLSLVADPEPDGPVDVPSDTRVPRPDSNRVMTTAAVWAMSCCTPPP